MKTTSPAQDVLSVLILEDNHIDCELTLERLLSAGFRLEPVIATCRAEFVEQLSAGTFDLVLADFSLPDFDGLTALQMVRERDAHIPFIFVSGVLGEDVAVETLHRGATDYVLKQRMERLAPAITRALNVYSEHLSRVRAEAQLRDTEQLFQRLTDALPAMVWTADSSGALTYSNGAWMEYMGGAQVASWCDRSNLHIEDLSQCARAWKDALSSRKPMEVECRFLRTSDRSYRWHLVRAIPLRTDDPHSPWVGACTDIHVQKQKEDSLRTSEKLAVVGRMAGVIAHEINNPLESLVNLLYLLRENDTRTEPGTSLLKEAEQQLFRISNITRQTLTFYRDKATLGDIDCRSLLEDSIMLFRPRLLQKNIQVMIRVEDRIHLQGRTGELRQVIVNLVSNAIDAMADGGTLTISANCKDSFVSIEVQDTGNGIPEEVHSQLFQPFFSTKGSLGTGLGLWVSKSIVEAHRGKIGIASANGKTVVSILLPVEFSGEGSHTLYGPAENVH